MDVPDDFLRFIEQNRAKKGAIVELLLHRYRTQLETRSLKSLQDEADCYSKLEVELTQEIDLSGTEKSKEELVADFVQRRQNYLKSLSFQELANMLPVE